jgi:predicted DNA-binding transcriptional regulator YafY
MRGRRLQRLLQVIALLRGPSSWNARRLADHFQSSRRNIYRDLAILELAGVPYWYDPDFGEGGGYRIRESFFFPHIGLTDQECFDLAVVTRLAEGQGIPLVNEACHVRDKLVGTLPAKQQALIAEASALFDILTVQSPDHANSRQIMRVLQEAVLARSQIEGTYQSPHDKAAKKVSLQPRRIFLCHGTWFLVAYDNKSGTSKLYRLARFASATVSKKPLTISPSFSLRDFLGNAWAVYPGDRDYHVELHFNRDAAPYIEETHWHQTQEIEPQKDGSLIFRATVSGLEELKYWVLSWGPRVVVRTPRELVVEIQFLAQSINDRYKPHS